MGGIHSLGLFFFLDVHRAYKFPFFGQSFLGQFLFFKIKKRSTVAVFVEEKLESCLASSFLLLQPPATPLVDKLSRVRSTPKRVCQVQLLIVFLWPQISVCRYALQSRDQI